MCLKFAGRNRNRRWFGRRRSDVGRSGSSSSRRKRRSVPRDNVRYVTDAVNVTIYPTYYSTVVRTRAHHTERHACARSRAKTWGIHRGERLLARSGSLEDFRCTCTLYDIARYTGKLCIRDGENTHMHTHARARDARHIRRGIVIVRNEIYKFHFRYWLFLIRVKFSFLVYL